MSGDSAYENVKLHFDKVMEVENVDVYAYDDVETALEGVDVYASMDGINYDHVTTLERNIQDATGDVVKLTVDMPGVVNARDLKIVARGKDGYTYPMVYEIEAYGRPAQEERVRATSYSYDDEVPFVTQSDILAADSDLTALSDGLDATVTTAGDYLSVIYDLGGFRQVEDITIKGNHGGFELLLSPDGYNYFSSAYYPASTTTSVAWGRAENNAKFVKLVFHKPDGANIILSEIELYTRKLKNLKPNESIPVRATLKPNNIAYIDWSDHNASGEQKTYNVYIEDSYFTDVAGLTAKKVQIDTTSATVTDVAANFAVYAGFAPESTYYVAVAEKGGSTVVAPIKVTTNSAVGGNSAAGIFCVNEFDGGAYIHSRSEIKTKLETGDYEKIKLWEADNITQEEIDALPEEGNADDKVRKLLGDIESVQKNRHFFYEESRIRNYITRGISWLPQGPGTAGELDDLGIYTYGHTNEPEITSTYKGNPEKFGTEFAANIKTTYANLHSASPNSFLYSPTCAGTDWAYDYIQALYTYTPDIGSHYDVLDVHMYSKTCDPSEEFIDGAENKSVPEKLIKKAELLNKLLADNGDSKMLVSTETGWSTSEETGVYAYTDEEKQAEFTARMYLSGLMSDVKEIYLYAFQDEGYLVNGEEPTSYITRVDKGSDNAYPDLMTGKSTNYYIARSNKSREHFYGVVDWFGDPKPGYYSFYTLGKMMRDAYFVEAIDMPALTYGAVFYDELKDKYITALWEVSGNGAMVHVTSSQDSLTRVDMYGGVTTVTPGTMALTTAPFYLYSDEPLTVGLKSRNLISGNGYGNADNNVEATYGKLSYDVTIANNDATISATNMPSDRDPDSYFSQGVFGVASTSVDNCIWSNFYSTTTEITVDLGSEFTVDGVDASAYADSAQKHFTKIKVEVSTDGTDYDVVVPETTLVDGTNAFIISGDTSGQYERLSINNFTPVKAKYVKVTMTGGTHQIVPNEVLVFGK